MAKEYERREGKEKGASMRRKGHFDWLKERKIPIEYEDIKKYLVEHGFKEENKAKKS